MNWNRRRRWIFEWGGRCTFGACAWLVGAALTLSRNAAAEGFRYVDRDGYVHEISASSGATEGGASDAVDGGRAAESLFPHMDAVREAAKLYSLPAELILAVMTIESGFDPRAVSPRGAIGLMQLMPATAAELRLADPFDPRENTLGGARHLRILINGAKGDVILALAAYHAGVGATRRYGGMPPFPETQRYVARVLRVYQMYLERGATFASVMAGKIRAGRQSSREGAPIRAAGAPARTVAHPGAPGVRRAAGKE